MIDTDMLAPPVNPRWQDMPCNYRALWEFKVEEMKTLVRRWARGAGAVSGFPESEQ